MKSIDPEFELTLDDFCYHSLDKWLVRHQKEDPEREKNLEECALRLQRIQKLLGNDGDLILEYEDLKNWTDSDSEVLSYWKGCRDCVLILRRLELI